MKEFLSKLSGRNGLAVSISVFCQTSALILSTLMRGKVALPPQWFEQFPLLAAIGIAMSVSMTLTERIGTRLILYPARIVVLLVSAFALGPYVEIRFLLLFALAAEAFLLFNLKMGIPLFGFALLLMFIVFQPIPSWGYETLQLSAQGYFFLTAGALLSAGIFIFVSFLLDRKKQQSHELDRLLQAVNQLTDANVRFQDFANVIGRESIINERHRVSREIHDIVGYTFTNIIMLHEAALRIATEKPEQLLDLLLKSRKQAISGLEEVRASMLALRNTGEADLQGISAIQHLVNSFQGATGVQVDVHFGNMRWSISEDVEAVLFRTIQEGMTNSFRHGKASRINIQFFIESDILNLSIRDNGCGADDFKEGIGLQGMRERIQYLGGGIKAQSTADGFIVVAIIPMENNYGPNQASSGR